jgi:DNA-binding response OmpR family regulator
MPEMDGIEATQEIRKLPGFDKLPIVAMTAHAMSGDKEMSFKAGMNDHINKPIDVQELFKTIAKWLDLGNEESGNLLTEGGLGASNKAGNGEEGAGSKGDGGEGETGTGRSGSPQDAGQSAG